MRPKPSTAVGLSHRCMASTEGVQQCFVWFLLFKTQLPSPVLQLQTLISHTEFATLAFANPFNPCFCTKKVNRCAGHWPKSM
jgi:hypothetical protein